MNSRQILLPVYRALRPIVDRCHLNWFARPVWAAIWKGRTDRLIRAKQNGRIWLLDPDVALRGSELEMDTVRWLRSVIEPGMTAIDVGANIGQMTLEMAHLVGPSGRVIAIEPGPGNLAMLHRHLEGNGLADRVTVIPAACCALHGGRMELEIPAETVDGVGSGFQLRGIGIAPNPIDYSSPRARLMVDTVSLDGLVADLKLRPAVLKVDVEGAELEVIRGARSFLRAWRPALVVGFHPFAFSEPAAAQSEIVALCHDAGLNFGPSESEPWTQAEYFTRPQEAGLC